MEGLLGFNKGEAVICTGSVAHIIIKCMPQIFGGAMLFD